VEGDQYMTGARREAGRSGVVSLGLQRQPGGDHVRRGEILDRAVRKMGSSIYGEVRGRY